MSVFYDAANVILVKTLQQLQLTPAGFPANARVYAVPGALAWDECECGLLAIELQTAPYSSIFPNPDQQTDDGCRPLLALTLLVTILRCAPPIVKGGVAPSAQSLDDAAKIFYDDVEACLRGTSLGVSELYENYSVLQYALGPVNPAGGSGGCVGVTQQVFLGFANKWGPC